MTKSRPALTAWENDRTIVRFPDPAVEVVDERFRSLVVFNSLADSRVRSMRGRIDDRPARLNDSAGSKASGLQAALPHDMENDLPAGDKIISDYAAVASPPHSFRTHDCAAPFTPLFEQ